ncbi:cation channel sperm-associated protein subunit zeta isoform X1 [Fukomys damarensis]|uniref:Testis-expressed sequence 40 protein n=1 Tax=Fukomys damarensis TaxID=885580 RepID=A0A091DD63_FUKDA|nr:cation channel sperm-associated protein subunit zeta isoform X1 [Fukomys damarensis]KFO28448.1 hypothetical protein H920_10309 [Fukomys damarensis]
MLDGGSAPFPLMEREPPPPRPAGSAWVRWGRTMEEEPFKAPPDHQSPGQVSRPNGLPNGCTRATPSQPHLSMQLSEVRGSSGQEGGGTVFEACEWDSQRGLQEDVDKSISLRDKDRFKSEDLDQHTLLELEPPRSRSLGNHLVEVASESEIRKESLSSAWEHADFQLYLAEQQKKLPLPLRELMETEALEILTKALKSYRSKIGENHFLTKELQRRVEELQRRRRLLWTSQ